MDSTSAGDWPVITTRMVSPPSDRLAAPSPLELCSELHFPKKVMPGRGWSILPGRGAGDQVLSEGRRGEEGEEGKEDAAGGKGGCQEPEGGLGWDCEQDIGRKEVERIAIRERDRRGGRWVRGSHMLATAQDAESVRGGCS